MIVRYIYSACVVIETKEIKICCDPWFTQGIYYGAWYQYPQIEDPIGAIGSIDFVYISHIHPDHYDPPFLKALLGANPSCRLIIGDTNQKFLSAKMRRDGFAPEEVSILSVGTTQLAVIANRAHSDINIDTALVVRDDEHVVVNMNDCAFDHDQVNRIKEFCGGNPDLACLPYAGAGPYPQAYIFRDETERQDASELKKQQFLELFEEYLSCFQPRFALPFAGLYYLGGTLRSMNSHRGIPDAVELPRLYGTKVVVLQEGHGRIDLRTGEIQHSRVEPYDSVARDEFLRQFDEIPYPFAVSNEVDSRDLVKKLEHAHVKACARLSDLPPGWICFKVPDSHYLCVASQHPGRVLVCASVDELSPREEIYIDSRLLDGLLDGNFHWNNAEIGSHFCFRREPESYDRRVYNLLNFLHV